MSESVHPDFLQSQQLPDKVDDKVFIPYWTCKGCGRITLVESDLQRTELGDRVFEYCVYCEQFNAPPVPETTPDGMDIIFDDLTPDDAA